MTRQQVHHLILALIAKFDGWNIQISFDDKNNRYYVELDEEAPSAETRRHLRRGFILFEILNTSFVMKMMLRELKLLEARENK